MSRFPLLAAVAASVALSTTAGAAPVRTVSAAYTGSGVDSVAGVTPALYGEASGQGSELEAVTLTPRAGEKTITVTLADRLGRPVLAAVVQHLGEATFDDVELGRVCAGAPGRFRLAADAKPVTVYLLTGTCPAGPSVPTTGTVRMGFTR
jgi:hypothetical protein